jgi:K+-transporting ATPase KdpF subunit
MLYQTKMGGRAVEFMIAGLVALGIVIYLVYTLIYPEKF